MIGVEAQFQKKQYNPAAPDWALGASAEVAEFLPHSQSVTPAIVSPRFISFLSVSSQFFVSSMRMDTDLDRQPIMKSTNKLGRISFSNPFDASNNGRVDNSFPGYGSAKLQRQRRTPLYEGYRPLQPTGADVSPTSKTNSGSANDTLVVVRLPTSDGKRRSVCKMLRNGQSPILDTSATGPVPVQQSTRSNQRDLSGDAIPFRPISTGAGPSTVFRPWPQKPGFTSPPSSGTSSSAGSPWSSGRKGRDHNNRTPRDIRTKHAPSQSFHSRHFVHTTKRRSSHFTQSEPNGNLTHGLFDPYVSSSTTLPNPSLGPHQPPLNPYAQDTSVAAGAAYYQPSSYTQPIQYHLYSSLGPHRENLLPYQRTAHDFFIPDGLREDLQRKSAATLQTLPSMCSLDETWAHGIANKLRFHLTSTNRTLPFSCATRHYEPEKCGTFWISELGIQSCIKQGRKYLCSKKTRRLEMQL